MDARLKGEVRRRAGFRCEYCLFHPRRDRWAEHFAWEQAKLIGLTPVGWATVSVLQINRPDAVLVREALMEEDQYLAKPKGARD